VKLGWRRTLSDLRQFDLNIASSRFSLPSSVSQPSSTHIQLPKSSAKPQQRVHSRSIPAGSAELRDSGRPDAEGPLRGHWTAQTWCSASSPRPRPRQTAIHLHHDVYRLPPSSARTRPLTMSAFHPQSYSRAARPLVPRIPAVDRGLR
jgi:hypothetical protein